MSPVDPLLHQGDSDDDRGIANRHVFNEGWAEAIAVVNRARERGEWPFTLSRPGWDAQNAAALGTCQPRATQGPDATKIVEGGS